MTSQTTNTLQEEIAAAQRKLNACRDFGERRRLVGYIQGLNTALYVISQQRETAVEVPY